MSWHNLKTWAGWALRIVVVFMFFVLDIKVHAQVVIETAKGKVEIEKNKDVVDLKQLPLKWDDTHDLEIQTLENGLTRFSFDGNHGGLGPQSAVFLSDRKQARFSEGHGYFNLQNRETPFRVQTPQAEIQTKGGEFLVEVGGGRTSVSVLNGEVSLYDRAAKKSLPIQPGYSGWLGGLLASGAHARPTRAEACDLQRVMETIRPILGWSDQEYDKHFESLKSLWKDAVFKVGEDSQTSLDNDIRTLNHFLEHQRKLEAEKNQEQAKLRKLFREKTLGVPGENPELPWESDRSPSSDDQ